MEVELGPFDGQIKTVVEERMNDAGRLVRVTRKIRMKLVRETVASDVAARKLWKKYGASAGDPPGPNLSTTVVGEPVFLALSTNSRDYDRSAPPTPTETKSIICRLCQGEHFSFNCPLRDSLIEEADRKEKERIAALRPATASTKYVPPSLRREGMTMQEMMDATPESYPVRINNLGDITSEADLRALCGPFGTLTRVFVAKDERTAKCRGFGYVNFADQSSAEKCVAKLNGYQYGNMILKAELAQQRQ